MREDGRPEPPLFPFGALRSIICDQIIASRTDFLLPSARAAKRLVMPRAPLGAKRQSRGQNDRELAEREGFEPHFPLLCVN